MGSSDPVFPLPTRVMFLRNGPGGLRSRAVLPRRLVNLSHAIGGGRTPTLGLVAAEGCTMTRWVTNSDRDSRPNGHVRLMVETGVASLTRDRKKKSC